MIERVEVLRGGDRLDLPPHEALVCEKADHTIDGGSLSFDWSAPDRSNRVNAYASFRNTARESYYGGVKNIFDAYQSDFDKGEARDSGYVYGPLMPRSWFLGVKIRF